jgi:hypothetical protein
MKKYHGLAVELRDILADNTIEFANKCIKKGYKFTVSEFAGLVLTAYTSSLFTCLQNITDDDPEAKAVTLELKKKIIDAVKGTEININLH